MSENIKGQADVWEKWAWLWSAVFYTTLVLSSVLMVRDANRSAPIWVAALLTLVMVLWHWGGIRLAYRDMEAWDERAMVRFTILVGDIVLWFVLVNISVAYYAALFGLFGQVFRHLRIRYAAIAVVLLTVATIFEQTSDRLGTFTLTEPTIWLFFFMGLAAVMLGVWVTAIIEQSTRRRELIEKLEAAQAELAAAERREGILEERQRLAQEIHDTLAQGFTSIVMHLEAAEQALPGDPERLQRHIDRAKSTARSSLDQARRVVGDLRPDLLEQHSLPEAIERTAKRWGEESGIRITTMVTGEAVPLHPNIEVTLLRAAQEALHNIRKHAQATDVQLTLSYMGDVVILDVQDNGLGVDEAASSGAAPFALSGGYGLQAMRERAERLGGSATLESEPGEGTTVVVTIPLAG